MELWSPYQMEILLHHHCSRSRFEREDAPAYGPAVAGLMELGLFEYRDGIPQTTTLGAGLIHLWLSTPIPLVKYVDPRLREAN